MDLVSPKGVRLSVTDERGKELLKQGYTESVVAKAAPAPAPVPVQKPTPVRRTRRTKTEK